MLEPVLVSERLEWFDFVLFQFHFVVQSLVLAAERWIEEKMPLVGDRA